MKVVNVTLAHSPVNGGVTKALQDFQRALGGTILSLDDGKAPRVTPESQGGVVYVENRAFPARKSHLRLSKRARGRMATVLRGADLVICHSIYRGHVSFVRRYCGKNKIPFWIVPHGALDPYVFRRGDAAVKKLWLRLYGLQAFKSASFVIFATSREREKAGAIYQGENTQVVFWPVDRIPEPKGLTRIEWRKSIGIRGDNRVLLYLGRYDEMKRPHETIDAFSAARCERTTLLMVGNDYGVSRESLRNHAAKLSLGDSIVSGPLYGRDKDACFSFADGFISLSHRENFGYTTAEALIAGLPVILSTGNDLSAEVEATNCGWICPDVSLSAIEAIRAFDRETNAKLIDRGARGSAWARDNLGFQRYQSELQELVRLTVSGSWREAVTNV